MSKPSILVNTGRLSPLSVGTVSRVQNGTDALQQIELIQLQQNAMVFAQLADAFPAAGASVNHIQVGTSERPDIQRVTLLPLPYDGTFDLVLDGVTYWEIPFDVTRSGLQDILGAAYVVTRRATNVWDIRTAALAALGDATVDPARLVVPTGVSGILGLNTMAVWLAFIATAENVKTFTLEVQTVAPGGDPQTILQMQVQVSRNVVNLATIASATVLGLQDTYTALFAGVTATWSTAITALTGGGTALDAVPTEALTLGARYDFPLNGFINTFILKAGAADVTDPTGQIAPLDYDAATNNKHWERQG